MESIWNVLALLIIPAMHSSLLHAHREHKVHNIVLYPDKQSWCKTTPIKQVVTWPQCSSQELDNNVCVGACFSYMVPHSEPSAPGDLIRPYCDSCQPFDSVWHTVVLECKDEENNSITMQKKVQIITNCSCSSCLESSRIKSDYNTLLQSLSDENIDKNTNVVHETPDLLLNPNLKSLKNGSKDGIEANERFLQLFKEFKESKKLEEFDEKELFSKFEEKVDLDKIRELIDKYSREEKHHPKHHVKQHELQEAQEEREQTGQADEHEQHAKQEQPQAQAQPQHPHPHHQHQHQHHGPTLHRGPHHSMVLDADVKEKIDVEPHYLQPAVAGQEISYHDNVLVAEKSKKQDLI